MDIVIFLLPLDNLFALYALLFGMIIIAAFGAPLPEEVTLLLAGYLAYLGFADFWTVVFVLSTSIVAADICGYTVGRIAGDFLDEKIFGRFEVTRNLLLKGKRYIDRSGEKVVLLTRPIWGVRFIVPIMMGHFRMNLKRFVFYDIIASIPYTLAFIALSYYLGSVFTLIADIETFKTFVGWAAAVFLVVWFILRYVKKRRMRAGTED